MRRVLLVAVIVVAGMMIPTTSATAEEGGDDRLYGWVSYIDKINQGGDYPHVKNAYTRVRIKGTSARIIQTSGSWTNVSSAGWDCTKTTTLTYVGPGHSKPGLFDNGYYIDSTKGSKKYRIILQSMLKRANVTESASPAGCTSVHNRAEDQWEDMEIGCGQPAWGGPLPYCTTKDKHHFKGSTKHNFVFTEGTSSFEAHWNLVDDPDKDPCKALADRCLDNDTLKVDVAPTGTSGDLGVVCGKARFTWRSVAGRARTVKKGEKACVFLVSNQSAKLLLDVVRSEDQTLDTAFAGVLFKKQVANFVGDAAVWGPRQRAKKAILRSLANSLVKVTNRVDVISTAGKAVGLLSVPLAASFVVNQIENNDACIQVFVDKDGARLKTDWNMVYAHATDAKLKQAKVYRKVDRKRKLDKIEPVNLGMKCTPSGKVSVSRSTSDAMSSRVSTFFDIR